MNKDMSLRSVFGMAVGLVVAAQLLLAPASAQVDNIDTRRLQSSREELKASVTRLEQIVQSQAHSESFRERARKDLVVLRQRIDEGDFQVGDRVALQVQGHVELTDTFTVGPQRQIVLPGMGDISLAGVLRSELIDHLTSQLRRYLRDPVVHASALVRLGMFGEVSDPGFYVVPAEALLGDALMLAGGPTRDADFKKMQIRRGDELITETGVLQHAITEGRTVDQLNLRAGDEITVGKRGGIGGSLRAGLLLLTTVLVAVRSIM
jgi:protein involved in polysaccharide export with SLBB domain